MGTMLDFSERIYRIALKVAESLEPGYEEVLYKRAMAIELRKQGINFMVEYPLSVYYDEERIGNYFADIFIDDEYQMILELKAVEALAPRFSVQLVNYLTATKVEYGAIINFGTYPLQYVPRTRKYNKYWRPLKSHGIKR